MAFDTFRKWTLAAVGHEFEHILSIDEDDPKIDQYRKLFPLGSVLINKNRSAIDAINNAAKIVTGNIIIVVSDDTGTLHNWHNKISQATEGKQDFIVKTQDGIQPWIITMPIMDRAYYNRFGYIYHSDYKHMFCDTELTCVADITGRKITSSLLFKHNHYSVGGMVKDEVSARADATWAQGEKLFLERYKRNFDLPQGNPIQDNGMINWLKKKVA